MANRTIGVVTSTRADYGIFRPLLFRLRDEPSVQLDLYVTGMHLSHAFGHTVDAIRADGFEPKVCIDILGTREDMGQEVADTVGRFNTQFALDKPDLLVVLGDRSEIFGVATAAMMNRIPIVHIHGGEVTDGALDNVFRHAITKMSYLHFASTASYRKRIVQMGEHPDRVFDVGAMGVENCLTLPLLSKGDLSAELGVELGDYVVVVFHPETMRATAPVDQYKNVLRGLEGLGDKQCIFIFSNSDPGGLAINEAIEQHCAATGATWFKSLQALHYLSLIKHAEVLVGNSSSGIIEAPSLGTPTLNIGDRQKGREAAASVVHVGDEPEVIRAALARILANPFREADFQSPYGDGGTSQRIADILTRYPLEQIELAKAFYDID
jgi:GDP/UDP-N,N'-diacetylbacillosamine 2-epimerase (hydrolysing)